MGLLDAFPRWTPKTGHPWTPQNRPPRVGVRDVDEAEGAVLPRRDGQRFGRREEASSIGAGAAEWPPKPATTEGVSTDSGQWPKPGRAPASSVGKGSSARAQRARAT